MLTNLKIPCWMVLSSLLALLFAGCGETQAPTFDPSIYLNEFSCTPSESVPLETNCSTTVASIDELEMTPRCEPSMSEGFRQYADADRLEALAALVSDGATADAEVYDRIVRDILAIREARPDLTQVVGYRPDAQGIVLDVDLETFTQMEAGQYEAWDCLNTLFKAFEPALWRSMINPEITSVSIGFEGIYDVTAVAEEYALLPSVLSAYANVFVGDRGDTCVTIVGNEWRYIFDDASGDCPSGCIDHTYYRFITTEDGGVTAAGEWKNRSGTEPPPWLLATGLVESCY